MQIKKTVVLQEENEEAILFDSESLLTLWLNETAIWTFKFLREGLDEKAILEELKKSYEGVNDEELSKDIHFCIENFKQYGFVS